jgi:hypothetical protein
MDEEIVKQILDELFSSFEDSETQSAALLLFLKDQGIATEAKLAPYFEQAANTSEVRWRAARVRMGALLASAMKTPEPPAEKKAATEEKSQGSAEKNGESAPAADTKKADGQAPEPKPEGSKDASATATPPEGATERPKKTSGPEDTQDIADEEAAIPSKAAS